MHNQIYSLWARLQPVCSILNKYTFHLLPHVTNALTSVCPQTRAVLGNNSAATPAAYGLKACRLLFFAALLTLTGAAQAQTAAESVTFDGEQTVTEGNGVNFGLNRSVALPIGEYAFTAQDADGLPIHAAISSTSTVAAQGSNSFKYLSTRATRYDTWLRFPGFDAGDQVEIRVRKNNPQAFPDDNFWWVVSSSENPADWVDPQNSRSLPQPSSLAPYDTSPQPQGLLGPTSTPDWPIGEQSWDGDYARGGSYSSGAFATDWQATVTVSECGNFFAFGKYDPWNADDSYFVQYRAPGGTWQDVAASDFNSINPTDASVGCVLPSPELTHIKSASLDDGGDGVADAGDQITYTFTVENTGNAAATNVSIA
ncbi:MAG: DUF11 domain-containing protein, partial [Schleiferiaceae bacterium]|nr:DUF11 domain-containing protein [Schleiferiaceae bacterium]